MRRFRLLIIFVAITLCSSLAYAQQAARDPKKEQAILDNLALLSPEVVQTFQRGTLALDKGDYAQAAQLYREVVRQVPNFSPALRRLGFSLAGIGQTDDAIELMERAVKIDRSPENLISLAEMLAYPGENKSGTDSQKTWAFELAKEASQQSQGQDDPTYTLILAQIALDLRRDAEFRQATDILLRKYPDQMATHYFHGVELAIDGNWVRAEKEIKQAERMGLPRQSAEALLDSGIRTHAREWLGAYFCLLLVVLWLVGLIFLFLAGKVFSMLTIRSIESADVSLSMSRAESLLRRCYGQLINVAGMYYYVSIPFVILFVLAIAGSIIYAFLFVGYIPIKLMIILGIGAVITVYKMVGSLFVPANSDEPGRSLSRREAPGLWQLTRDVADKLGTKPIDDIRVTPGTELAVYERGSRSDRRNGRGRRALVLGLGLIPDFDQNPFCAVLAHEYGHLAHRDTAGGDVAMRVNRNMMNFAYAMAEAGQAVWWNVGFQFLRLYHFLFLRISHGATRLQEVLADRTAARLYGAQPFEEGLRHVVRRQIEFKTCTKKELQRSIAAGKPFENLYTLETVPDKWLEEEVHGALNRQTSEDDTHPSPKDRFRLASRVICQNHSAAPSGPMWNLFADREAITLEMSSQMEMLTKASAALAIAAFRTRAPISQ